MSRYGEGGPGEPGTVMVVSFVLEGQQFNAHTSGTQGFAFNESVSFVINCDGQEEVDYFWNVLTDGGSEGNWLKDKFGVSWQVVPSGLVELLSDPDGGRSQRALTAMLTMHKLDLGEMRRAADAVEKVEVGVDTQMMECLP